MVQDESKEIRRLAAIMFTDIVGYSGITQKNEALALELLKEHNKVLRVIFDKYRGREVKTIGDAFLVEFTNVLDATHCAVECQRALEERNQTVSPERKVEIRIGIHVGDVVYRDNDVFGDGVNIAARIQPLAEPGGICLSEDVARQIQNKIEMPVLSLGQGDLKNIKLGVALYKILLPWKQEKLTWTLRIAHAFQRRRFQRAALATLGLLVLLFLAIKFEYLKFGLGRGIKLNPDMTFKLLNVPFTDVDQNIAMTQDGNWLAFIASNAKGRSGIYWMNINGGMPKRLTPDSDEVFYSSIDLSPDGSRIAATRMNATSKPKPFSWEFLIIPTLGGKSISLKCLGPYIKWQSNDRIGCSRNSSLWTVKSDGSDEHLEFKDTLSTGKDPSIGFSWAPDKQSVAWLRTFTDNHQEIIIHNLTSHSEAQITFQKSKINDLFWTSQNQIIYSSDKSGNYNLWAVDANGGEPVQISKGNNADLSMIASADCKRILYFQRQQKWDIWLAKSDGSDERIVSSGEGFITMPMIAPNLDHIFFIGILPRKGLFVMNQDGSDQKQLLSGDSLYVLQAGLSPNGTMIGFTSKQNNEFVTYIVRVDRPNEVMKVASGVFHKWFDDNQLILGDYPRLQCKLVSVDGKVSNSIFRDSTDVMASAKSRFVFYDYRTKDYFAVALKNPKEVYDALENKLRISPKLLVHGFAIPDKDLNFLLVTKNGKEIWKYPVDGSAPTRLGLFPHMMEGSYFDLSKDGKTVAYNTWNEIGRLCLIENFQ